MDFKQIEAFISVAKLKSFSKAANTIYLSQPTISSHILSLEKELNVQLFDRNSKEVNLTPAGKCFFDYAIDIINTRNSAISSLSYFNNIISGKLNLAASTTPCNTIVPGLVSKFSSHYPNIQFNIVEQASGDIINNLINLNSEIGIVGSMIESDKIKSYTLMEDDLVLVSSTGMNLPEEVSAYSLANYRFIMRDKKSATRKTFEMEFAELNIPNGNLDICCEVNNLDTLLRFVKAGLGVSIISRQVALDYVRAGNLRCSRVRELSLKRNIYLLINSKRTLTPTARAFVNLCKEIYKLED